MTGRSVAAHFSDVGPKVDGKLTDLVWEEAIAGGDLYQYEPKIGANMTEKTVFKIVYDHHNLYLGVWCFDSNPRGILARNLQNGTGIFADDYIYFAFDGDAAGKIANGLGGAIAGIPGVGPVFEGFTKGVGAFAKNLDGAVKGLPTDLQRAISGAAAQVGANLIGKAFKKPNVVKDVGRQVAQNIKFVESPITQANAIAETANEVHRKIYKSTGDKTFLNVANTARKTAKRFGKKLVKKNSLYVLDTTKRSVTQPSKIVNSQLTDIANPPVKKSDNSGICWVFGNEITDAQYNNTKNYTPYNSLQECLDSGGRLSMAG